MASPNVIPKETLSAYERWEMASFDQPRAPVALTTVEQVETIHQQARDEGHRTGYEAGYEEGKKRAAAEAARLATLVNTFDQETRELDQRIAQQVLDVALEIARRMLGSALAVRPDLVLPVIQEAIRGLPVLGEDRRLHAHPDDAALAREHMGESLSGWGWKIVDDAAIARGGCRVSTSQGEVDASAGTRWRRIVAGLGRDDAWLTQNEE